MAKARGTTKSPGKTRTQPPATVAADRIDPPHGGSASKSIGARTPGEAEALKGPSAPGAQVKQVGPSDIRPANAGKGKHVRVGGDNWEDQIASVGGTTQSPGVRQPGSVKSVGPTDIGYQLLTTGRILPLTTAQKTGEIKSGRALVTYTPLLISGVGIAHPWSKFAGAPGSKAGGITGFGASSTGDTILISGRKGAFLPEPLESTLTEPEAVVIPGDTGIYVETMERLEEEREEEAEEEE